MLVPALMAVTVHEVAHGFIAEKFGDPTARLLGRLTLNPLKHLDPLGTLVLLLVGFGWARPVPVNHENLRHPHRDMAWVALAGPTANFLLAMGSALALRLIGPLSDAWSFSQPVLVPLSLMLAFSLYINLLLMVINLFPLPPLDGGRVLMGVLPPPAARVLGRVEPLGLLLVLLVLFFTDLWQLYIAPFLQGAMGLLVGEQMATVERVITYLFSR